MATGALPGRTLTNTVGPTGVAVQPCGSCSASRTLPSIALPDAVSVTRTTEVLPGCTTEGALTETCRAAGVTKGSYFHHFKTKEALGIAAARHWMALTSAFFAAAPYHDPADPRDRVLAYVAFRKSMITGDIAEFSCLVGTMAQELFSVSPAVRDACGEAMFGHTATLEADIDAARKAYDIGGNWTTASLARHTQGVLQGAFILAKAGNDAAPAREMLDHLDRYIRLLFNAPEEETAPS